MTPDRNETVFRKRADRPDRYIKPLRRIAALCGISFEKAAPIVYNNSIDIIAACCTAVLKKERQESAALCIR